MDDSLTERVLAVLAGLIDPFTGKLRPNEFAGAVRQIAARLDVSWPAVVLRIRADAMPSRSRIEEHYAQRRYPPCPGCADTECRECRRSEVELGRFDAAQLIDMLDLATKVGLDYADVQRERRRREKRGLG